MAFNANEHMMKLKGKDYLQVAWRLVWFREEHPDWGINAECIEQNEEHAFFKAVICDANGIQKSSGHGSESKRDFNDFIEKAETKAVGRALAMLGYGTQFAADELDEGERIVDSPISREKPEPVKAEATQEQKQTMKYRSDVMSTIMGTHGISNIDLNKQYAIYCKNVLKMERTPTLSSLTDEQFDDMVLAINEELKKGVA